MDYFFKSEGCPSCKKIFNLLLKYKNWSSLVTLVDVEFNKEKKKNWTWIEGKSSGESPVSKVPAFYFSNKDKLLIGYDAIAEEIENDDRFDKL